ncbi:ABC transporter substrate-binding protein [Paradesulfitobacterium aromaticivorans]
MSRFKWLLAVVLVFTMVGSLVGCGTQTANNDSKSQAKEILVGSIHPMTGSMAYEGKAITNAAQLAVDEINAAGGIKSLGGAKLKLLVGDSQGLPDKASSEAQRLIREGAVALIGTYTSSSTVTATQEAEKAQTPFLITVAATTNIQERGFKYSFRIQPNADTFSEDFLRYMKEIKTPDIKTIALVHENSLFGTYFADYVKKNIAKADLTMVGDIPYAASTATLSSEVTKLAGLNPDLVVGVGYYRDQALLIKTIRERNLKFKGIVGIANGAISDPKIIQDLGQGAEGLMDVNYRWNPNAQSSEKVLAAYKDKFSDNMSPHAMFGYTAIQVLADALERASSTEKVKVRDALAQTNFTNHILPQDAIKFNDKGENVNAQAVLVQIQNGRQVVVYPEKYAQAKLIFPLK